MAQYNPEKHHRKSIRYDGYDYTAAGAYFVTFCVRWGRCLLGMIKNQEICLSGAGMIVDDAWRKLAKRFPTIQCDAFQLMPNHGHFIVWLTPLRTPSVGASLNDAPAGLKRPQWDKNAPALGEVVRSFKAAATTEIRFWFPELRFEWLVNYWERIIRNEEELERYRSYIHSNPLRWTEDQFHPDAPPNPFNQAWKL